MIFARARTCFSNGFRVRKAAQSVRRYQVNCVCHHLQRSSAVTRLSRKVKKKRGREIDGQGKERGRVNEVYSWSSSSTDASTSISEVRKKLHVICTSQGSFL